MFLSRNIVSNLIRRRIEATSSSRFICQEVAESDKLENAKNNKDTKVPGVIKGRIVVDHPVETSIKYLESTAYQSTYGNNSIWKLYRRNHKGGLPPRKTRQNCVLKGKISTGSPCPICRDEYLVLDPRNIKLLEQFISPHTGETLSYTVTGLCQRKHQQLLISLEQAKDLGLITFHVPFRYYNYSLYKPKS